MKTITRLFAPAALIIAASACTGEMKDQLTPAAPLGPGQERFTVTIENENGTRVSLDESSGKLYWGEYDYLSLFAGEGTLGGARFKPEIDAPSATAVFTGTLDRSGMKEDDYVYAIFPETPYDEVSGGVLKVPLVPSESYGQTIFEGKDLLSVQLIPHYLSSYFPMVARTKDDKLSFYNVCGGLKFTVAHNNIISVIVKNNDGTPLMGVMEVSFGEDGKPVFQGISVPKELTDVSLPLDEYWLMDAGSNYDYFLAPGEDYYVPLPPRTYSQGFTITYRTPSTCATYDIPGRVDIKRSVFSRLSQRDKDLEFKPIEGNIAFTNDAFKQFCISNFDKNADGELSYAEALEVKEIEIRDAATYGTLPDEIMYFENLVALTFRGTTEAPGSLQSFQNYWFPELQLLDLTCNNIHNTMNMECNKKLRILYLQGNRLPSLTLDNPDLQSLYLNVNELSSLDVSKCPELRILYCGKNLLTSLDVSGLAHLTELMCPSNPELSSLTVGDKPEMTYLSCVSCKLGNLTIGDAPELEKLYCYGNVLTSLNITNSPKMTLLSCYTNLLESLDFSGCKGLTNLFCSYNPLGSIDVSQLSDLEVLYCCGNTLKSIDISNNPKLLYFRCFDNDLESLDVSHNPELTEIVFGSNPMTSLDVSNNPKLYYFDAVYTENYRYNTYTSPLRYLYLAEGQVIPEVNEGRLDATLPYSTIVTTKTAPAGHPHADMFGSYKFSAYTDISGTAPADKVYETREWTCTLSEYEGDITKAWLTPVCYLFSTDAEVAAKSAVYVQLRGDGSGFMIPTPQKIEADGQYLWGVDGDTYCYVWDGEESGGSYNTGSNSILKFDSSGPGTFEASRSFGFGMDPDHMGFYSQPLYYGLVNYHSAGHPTVITKQ